MPIFEAFLLYYKKTVIFIRYQTYVLYSYYESHITPILKTVKVLFIEVCLKESCHSQGLA